MPTKIMMTEDEIRVLVSRHLAMKGVLARPHELQWSVDQQGVIGIECETIAIQKRTDITDADLIRLEQEGWNRAEVAKMYGTCRQTISEMYSDLHARTGFGKGSFTGHNKRVNQKKEGR